MIQYAIYASPGGALLADYTHKAAGVKLSTNGRGYADCAANIPLEMPEAFTWYDQPGLPHVELTDNGLTVWEGRLEDPGITGGGLAAGALGYSRALADVPYIAFWSKTKLDAFVETTVDMGVTYSEAGRWQLDTNNRLMIELVKNNAYTLNKAAGLLSSVPYGSTRNIIGMQFSLEQNLTANFTWRAVTFNGDVSLGLTGGTVQASAVGTAALVNRAYHLTFTAQTTAGLDLLCSTANTYLGETGANYVKITNLRLVSSTTNRVNTTLTANTAAGSVSAPVGSTAGMYIGMQLVIDSGSATSEMVTVTAITDATHFTATFANAHTNGNAVQGFRVLADEIAADLAVATNAANPTQLSSTAALIQSPGVDLLDEVYEDQYGTDILDYLANRGDTSFRRWEWAVWDDRRLVFQPHGQGRIWYVDITDLEVIRTLEQLANSVYATYSDANNRMLRTTSNTDSFSTIKYGLTRRQAVAASTTLVYQAQTHRDTALADQKDPLPQAKIAFDSVYDSSGGRRLLHEVRAGDTFVIRNLPPTLSTAIDRIRTFRLTRTELDLDTGVLTVEPEAPLPSLEQQLAVTVGGS